jgi:hypothetical protein
VVVAAGASPFTTTCRGIATAVASQAIRAYVRPVRPSSALYVRERVAHRQHSDEQGEAKARQTAVRDAERFEAMGSNYDPASRSWSPIWLRINPTHGPARREAWEALRLAAASGGGGYDHRSGLWRLDNPDHGSVALVSSLWDKHCYEAMPYRNPGSTTRR